MATGSGKTTVMGMLAAWSILNKVNDRSDARFSDVVLIVCPNVTIRDRLAELNPDNGEASLYRTRDLVPSRLMVNLRRGRVLVTNWHIFERRTPQTAGDAPAKVVQVGVPVQTTELIRIGDKTTTARGKRYLDLDTYRKQVALGQLRVAEGGEKYDKQGNLESAKVVAFRRVESETAWIQRILGRAVGGKQNSLVLNDDDETHVHLFTFSGEGAVETGGWGVLMGDDWLDAAGDQDTASRNYIDLLCAATGKKLNKPWDYADRSANESPHRCADCGRGSMAGRSKCVYCGGTIVTDGEA